VNCATIAGEDAKPSQWLRRKARKQPSRVRVADQREVPAGDRARRPQPTKYGQREAERGADRAQIARKAA
jgi:hypothetical protein